jgi:hypothetical protein
VATRQVFEAAGVTPLEAAKARFKMEDQELGGPDLTEHEASIADVWDQADAAAVGACCAGWDKIPATANLEIPRAPG